MWNQQKRHLDSQLSPGESLLWSGQPRQGIFLRASDAYMIPFSLLGGAFAVLWNVMAWDAPTFFRLAGILPLLYSVHFVFGRFLVDAWQRSRTFYGVTNDRVIIVSGIFSTTVKSLSLRTMTDITLSERRDLSGTVTFGPVDDVSDWKSKLPFKTSQNEPPVYPTLDTIQNAKHVYETIRNAQRAVA